MHADGLQLRGLKRRPDLVEACLGCFDLAIADSLDRAQRFGGLLGKDGPHSVELDAESRQLLCAGACGESRGERACLQKSSSGNHAYIMAREWGADYGFFAGAGAARRRISRGAPGRRA